MAGTRKQKRSLRKRCRASTSENDPIKPWPGRIDHVEVTERPSEDTGLPEVGIRPVLAALIFFITGYATGAEQIGLLETVLLIAFGGLLFPNAKHLLSRLLER